MSKTPDWYNKKLTGQQQGRRKDRQGWQAERITRRTERGAKKEKRKIPGANHPTTQLVTEKGKKRIENREIKSPEAKGKWDNLRKTG